jgi:hypothetical protein
VDVEITEKDAQGGSDSYASPRSIATFQDKIGRDEGAPILQGTGANDG